MTTWNPADKTSQIVLSNGNLTATNTAGGSGDQGVRSTDSKAASKVYFEVQPSATAGGADSGFGVALAAATFPGLGSNAASGAIIYNNSRNVWINGTQVGTAVLTFSAGDWIGVAVDQVNNSIWFRNASTNSNWNGSGTANPATNTGGLSISGISGSLFIACVVQVTNVSPAYTMNAGASAFVNAIPSGFSAWSVNPATSTVWNPADATATLSNNGLTAATAGGATQLGARTIFSNGTGKYYFEFFGANLTNGNTFTSIGLSSAGVTFANILNHGAGVLAWNAVDTVYLKGTLLATIDGYNNSNAAAASACQVALDLGNQLAWFRNSLGANGNWNANAANNPATGVGGISFATLGSPPWFVYCAPTPNNGAISFTGNFGNSAFNFTPPAGFVAWGAAASAGGAGLLFGGD
jgi:hypothetical protein